MPSAHTRPPRTLPPIQQPPWQLEIATVSSIGTNSQASVPLLHALPPPQSSPDAMASFILLLAASRPTSRLAGRVRRTSLKSKGGRRVDEGSSRCGLCIGSTLLEVVTEGWAEAAARRTTSTYHCPPRDLTRVSTDLLFCSCFPLFVFRSSQVPGPTTSDWPSDLITSSLLLLAASRHVRHLLPLQVAAPGLASGHRWNGYLGL